MLNKHWLPNRIINKETGSRCEVSSLELNTKLEVGSSNHIITQLIIIISIGFCYKRNNYNYDKGLKDNGYYPKEDQMTALISERRAEVSNHS